MKKTAGEEKPLAMGKYPFAIPVDGGEPIPAVRMVGGKRGKTLVVTAGVHGDEYVAIQAVKELIHEIRVEELAGQVVFVPVVNRGGFYAGTYLVPQDKENLNRCFPGKPNGSLTWRIAHALERELYTGADFLLDLHGGSPYETMTPLVFFPVDAGRELADITRRAAQQLSLAYLVQSYAKNGLYSWAAQCGIPALLVERGDGGRWSEAEVAACKKNVWELMQVLGIRPYHASEARPVEIGDARYETAQARGYWYCCKKAGEPFATGELLGRLTDEGDNILQALYAPYDGVVLYATNSLGVEAGFPLMAYGTAVPPCEG